MGNDSRSEQHNSCSKRTPPRWGNHSVTPKYPAPGSNVVIIPAPWSASPIYTEHAVVYLILSLIAVRAEQPQSRTTKPHVDERFVRPASAKHPHLRIPTHQSHLAGSNQRNIHIIKPNWIQIIGTQIIGTAALSTRRTLLMPTMKTDKFLHPLRTRVFCKMLPNSRPKPRSRHPPLSVKPDNFLHLLHATPCKTDNFLHLHAEVRQLSSSASRPFSGLFRLHRNPQADQTHAHHHSMMTFSLLLFFFTLLSFFTSYMRSRAISPTTSTFTLSIHCRRTLTEILLIPILHSSWTTQRQNTRSARTTTSLRSPPRSS